MRKLWAAGAAIVVCLALAGLPVAAQGGATAVTATSECQGVSDGTTETVDGVMQVTGVVVRCTDTASDARMSGTTTLTLNWQRYGNQYLYWGTRETEGPDGTWAGTLIGRSDDVNTETEGWMTNVLEGTGDYAGWTYVGTDHVTFPDGAAEGLLYEGPPPPGITPGPGPSSASEPVPSPSPAASLATIGLPADDGARIVAVEEPDARTRDLTVESPSVGTVKVRLLLPAGFDPDAETRWPVLYLLHGAGGNDYTSWTRETDVEALTADLPLLVVMPEGGPDGWYADWWNGGAGGPPMWETFHTGELPELLERNWQAGDERAVAGYSAGGLGAMAYAARHPGLFRAAASFSGMLHPVILDPSVVGFDVPPDLWGERTEQADVWAAHDPVELAAALEGTALYVSHGNGEPGPLDAAGAGFDVLEASSAAMNQAFVARMAELDIPVTDESGPGTHSMPYVERGLHEALPLLLEALGR